MIYLLILLTFGFSSYFAFFSFIMYLFWLAGELVLKEINFVGFLKTSISGVVIIVAGLSLFYSELFFNNISILSGDKNIIGVHEKSFFVERPIEDWINFSIRPWYFFLPPEKSLLFHGISEKSFDFIKSSGNYLADDYIPEEHAGLYLGWHWLIILIFITPYLVFSNKFDAKEEILVKKCYLVFLLIFLISLPPEFVLFGKKVFTPSYLLYLFTPIFRVLSRWAAVYYLMVIIVVNTTIDKFFKIYNVAYSKQLGVLFVLLVINVAIFSVRLPLVKLENPPQFSTFLSISNYGLAAYFPRTTYEDVFWIIDNQVPIINPPNIYNEKTGFSSEAFSKQLISKEGIDSAIEQKVDTVVVTKSEINYGALNVSSEGEVMDEKTLKFYLSNNFGEEVYEDSDVIIFHRNVN